MLRKREIIPPLTLRSRGGHKVHAWDFKQKRNLVILFLDGDCEECQRFLGELMRRTVEWREKDALVLLAFAGELPDVRRSPLPKHVIAGVDESGRGAEAFLGEGAFASGALKRRGVFVTDRYGEIADLWVVEEHDFPAVDEILGALNRVEIACEECEVPFWPLDDR